MNRKQRRAAKKPQDPRSREAKLALARAVSEHGKGNFEEAVRAYHEVLSLEPRNVDALMNLGTALAALGRREEALARFRAALLLQPNIAAMHRDFGVALKEFGLWGDALAALERALALAPTDVHALTSLGEVLIEVGRRAEAAVVLERALALEPLRAESYYWLHRAVYDDREPGPAIDALSKAVLNDPGMVLARYHLAVALDQRGDHAAVAQQLDNLHADKRVYRGAVDSLRYARSKSTAATRRFSTTRETLVFALEEAKKEGLVLELGVRYGISTRWIAERADSVVHGFDSFEGLPEEWHVLPKGSYSTHGALPEVPSNVELHVGLFATALPPFLATHEGPVRFLNVDCDLYSATACALELLGDRIVPGTVLVFDEYLLNDEWRNDEFKAFQEAVARRGWKYEYLAFSLHTGQAVVRVLA